MRELMNQNIDLIRVTMQIISSYGEYEARTALLINFEKKIKYECVPMVSRR
jgi:hypothetical protein